MAKQPEDEGDGRSHRAVDPPPPQERRTRRVLDRGELLDAVTRFVLEHGLHGFTLRQAALAAGTTHKVLLHHFGSADELIAESLDLIRTRSTVRGREAATALTGASLPDRLDAVWDFWTSPDGSPAVLGEALGLAMADPERFGGPGARATHDIVGTVADALSQNGQQDLAEHPDTSGETEVVATLLVAVMRGLSIDRQVTGDFERVDSAFAYFRDSLSSFRG